MSMPEQAGKVATGALDAMRSVPLAIALLIVNIGFLIFFAYIARSVASNSQERNKTQMDLIEKLVTDIRDCRQGPKENKP
jgi:hypothetical protein